MQRTEHHGHGHGRTAASERALLERARNGDAAAFDAVATMRLPAVHQLARAILGPGDADDAATCALVAAWHELPRLEDLARFDDWLDRIVISECRMRLGAAATSDAAALPADLLDRVSGAVRERPRKARTRSGRRTATVALAIGVPVLAVSLLAVVALGGGGGLGGFLGRGTAGSGPAVGSPALGALPSVETATASPSGGTPPLTGGSPQAGPPATLEPGAIAVVTLRGDNLRVRTMPGTSDPTTRLKPLLPAETRMLIVDGPVLADDHEWYEIQTDGELVNLFGWVAAGENGTAWIAPAAPRCWGQLGAATLAGLGRVDFPACYGRTEVKGRARAEGLWDAHGADGDCGWLRAGGVCDLDNPWLLLPSAPVTLVTDTGAEHDVTLAMPPDLAEALVKLPRQSTLLLTVSMDAPESAACRARDAGSGSALIPDDQAVTACRLQFVVQEVAFRDPAVDPSLDVPPN